MAIDDVVSECRDRMDKSVEALKRELVTIRTGRASPALVDSIPVSYYGSKTPLGQMASISVPEARVLLIQVWDRGALGDVEKAILTSDMGLTPNNDGEVIRISLPVLSEERRRDLVKLVGRKTEEGHVAVRNVRRDAMEGLRSLEKDGEIGKDESRRAQETVQKITNQHVGKMDEARRDKEAEVLEV